MARPMSRRRRRSRSMCQPGRTCYPSFMSNGATVGLHEASCAGRSAGSAVAHASSARPGAVRRSGSDASTRPARRVAPPSDADRAGRRATRRPRRGSALAAAIPVRRSAPPARAWDAPPGRARQPDRRSRARPPTATAATVSRPAPDRASAGGAPPDHAFRRDRLDAPLAAHRRRRRGAAGAAADLAPPRLAAGDPPRAGGRASAIRCGPSRRSRAPIAPAPRRRCWRWAASRPAPRSPRRRPSPGAALAARAVG